jgi:3-oxoacyl-[acyl-carrier-protein] synthase III
MSMFVQELQPAVFSLHMKTGSLKVGILEEATQDFGVEFAERFCNYTGLQTAVLFNDKENILSMSCDVVDAIPNVRSVDRIFAVTQSFEPRSPGLGYAIHQRLGFKPKTSCMDLNSACQGWADAVLLAKRLPGTTLVVTADNLGSKARQIKADQNVRYIFGDAVTACVVSEMPKFTTEVRQKTISAAYPYLQLSGDKMVMDGEAVSQAVCQNVPDMIRGFNQPTVFCHQANKSILKRIEMRTFNLEIPCSVQFYANCTSSSIPLMIYDYYRYKSYRTHTRTICGFGAGFGITAYNAMILDKPKML